MPPYCHIDTGNGTIHNLIYQKNLSGNIDVVSGKNMEKHVKQENDKSSRTKRNVSDLQAEYHKAVTQTCYQLTLDICLYLRLSENIQMDIQNNAFCPLKQGYGRI